ncbi:hypothetical protein K3495_g8940 [Podosphaera aphanis]|nr:hypothetical protein K3495_g8940 [Podosphaera aphanis]
MAPPNSRPPLASRIRASIDGRWSRSEVPTARNEHHNPISSTSPNSSFQIDNETIRHIIEQALNAKPFQNAIAANLAELIKPGIKDALDTIQPIVEAVYQHEVLLRKTNCSVENLLTKLETDISRPTPTNHNNVIEDDQVGKFKSIDTTSGLLADLSTNLATNNSKIDSIAHDLIPLKLNIENLGDFTEKENTRMEVLQAEVKQIKDSLKIVGEIPGKFDIIRSELESLSGSFRATSVDTHEELQKIYTTTQHQSSSISELKENKLNSDLLRAVELSNENYTANVASSNDVKQKSITENEMMAFVGEIKTEFASLKEIVDTKLGANIEKVLFLLTEHQKNMDFSKNSEILTAVAQANRSLESNATALNSLLTKNFDPAMNENLAKLEVMVGEIQGKLETHSTALTEIQFCAAGLSNHDVILEQIKSFHKDYTNALQAQAAAIEEFKPNFTSHNNETQNISDASQHLASISELTEKNNLIQEQLNSIISALQTQTSALNNIRLANPGNSDSQSTTVDEIRNISQSSTANFNETLVSIISELSGITEINKTQSDAINIMNVKLEAHSEAMNSIKDIQSSYAVILSDIIEIKENSFLLAETLSTVKNLQESHGNVLQSHSDTVSGFKSLQQLHSTQLESTNERLVDLSQTTNNFKSLQEAHMSILENINAKSEGNSEAINDVKFLQESHMVVLKGVEEKLVGHSDAENGFRNLLESYSNQLEHMSAKVTEHSEAVSHIKEFRKSHETVLSCLGEIQQRSISHSDIITGINEVLKEHMEVMRGIKDLHDSNSSSLAKLVDSTSHLDQIKNAFETQKSFSDSPAISSSALEAQITDLAATISTHSALLKQFNDVQKTETSNRDCIEPAEPSQITNILETVIENLAMQTALIGEIKDDISPEILSSLHNLEQVSDSQIKILSEIQEADLSDEILTFLHSSQENNLAHTASLAEIKSCPILSSPKIDLRLVEEKLVSIMTTLEDHRRCFDEIREKVDLTAAPNSEYTTRNMNIKSDDNDSYNLPSFIQKNNDITLSESTGKIFLLPKTKIIEQLVVTQYIDSDAKLDPDTEEGTEQAEPINKSEAISIPQRSEDEAIKVDGEEIEKLDSAILSDKKAVQGEKIVKAVELDSEAEVPVEKEIKPAQTEKNNDDPAIMPEDGVKPEDVQEDRAAFELATEVPEDVEVEPVHPEFAEKESEAELAITRNVEGEDGKALSEPAAELDEEIEAVGALIKVVDGNEVESSALQIEEFGAVTEAIDDKEDELAQTEVEVEVKQEFGATIVATDDDEFESAQLEAENFESAVSLEDKFDVAPEAIDDEQVEPALAEMEEIGVESPIAPVREVGPATEAIDDDVVESVRVEAEEKKVDSAVSPKVEIESPIASEINIEIATEATDNDVVDSVQVEAKEAETAISLGDDVDAATKAEAEADNDSSVMPEDEVEAAADARDDEEVEPAQVEVEEKEVDSTLVPDDKAEVAAEVTNDEVESVQAEAEKDIDSSVMPEDEVEAAAGVRDDEEVEPAQVEVEEKEVDSTLVPDDKAEVAAEVTNDEVESVQVEAEKDFDSSVTPVEEFEQAIQAADNKEDELAKTEIEVEVNGEVGSSAAPAEKFGTAIVAKDDDVIDSIKAEVEEGEVESSVPPVEEVEPTIEVSDDKEDEIIQVEVELEVKEEVGLSVVPEGEVRAATEATINDVVNSAQVEADEVDSTASLVNEVEAATMAVDDEEVEPAQAEVEEEEEEVDSSVVLVEEIGLATEAIDEVESSIVPAEEVKAVTKEIDGKEVEPAQAQAEVEEKVVSTIVPGEEVRAATTAAEDKKDELLKAEVEDKEVESAVAPEDEVKASVVLVEEIKAVAEAQEYKPVITQEEKEKIALEAGSDNENDLAVDEERDELRVDISTDTFSHYSGKKKLASSSDIREDDEKNEFFGEKVIEQPSPGTVLDRENPGFEASDTTLLPPDKSSGEIFDEHSSTEFNVDSVNFSLDDEFNSESKLGSKLENNPDEQSNEKIIGSDVQEDEAFDSSSQDDGSRADFVDGTKPISRRRSEKFEELLKKFEEGQEED